MLFRNELQNYRKDAHMFFNPCVLSTEWKSASWDEDGRFRILHNIVNMRIAKIELAFILEGRDM